MGRCVFRGCMWKRHGRIRLPEDTGAKLSSARNRCALVCPEPSCDSSGLLSMTCKAAHHPSQPVRFLFCHSADPVLRNPHSKPLTRPSLLMATIVLRMSFYHFPLTPAVHPHAQLRRHKAFSAACSLYGRRRTVLPLLDFYVLAW